MALAMQRDVIFEYRSKDEIIGASDIWTQFAQRQSQYIPSFNDLLFYLDDATVTPLLFVVTRGDTVTALATFLIYNTSRRFWLGERPLFGVPVRVAELFGSASLGSIEPDTAARFLQHVAADRTIDLITFADVPQSDFLFEAVTQGGWRGPRHISQHRTTRRLVNLPATMEEYWASLRPTTRKAALRDLKMFERLGPNYSVFTDEANVLPFLKRAAELSALTYQQKIGIGVEDTERTRSHFLRLAHEGRFRGYIASIDGVDVAFSWGDISHGAFYFRTTGYDQSFAKYSPGKAILFAMMRDLIDAGTVRTFDFSGRDMDFKERFSTAAVPCANFVISNWSRPRGVATIALDTTFAIPKTLGPKLLGADRAQRLRRALRARKNG